MLINFDFKQAHKDYESLKKESFSDLGDQLADLQRQLLVSNKRVIFMLDGWESSHKGYVLKRLIQELDPRYYKVWSFDQYGRKERQIPFMTEFFDQTPKEGHMTIFSRSFYYPVLSDLTLTDKELDHFIEDFAFAEQALARDNSLFVKIFMHQNQKMMENNIKELNASPERDVLISDQDFYQLDNYYQYLNHIDKILTKMPNYEEISPWHLVSAQNESTAAKKVLQVMIEELKNFLAIEEPLFTTVNLPNLPKEDLVKNVDLTKKISKTKYKAQIKDLQEEASSLVYQVYKEDRAVVVAFEGTDAAGKGGTIRRLTKFMDPRSVDLATVASPSEEEQERSYLWRFYRDFPVDGHITVFDRSWYGRVLIERVDELIPEFRWQQAYEEINDMEHHLAHHDDILIIKFLLLIDKDTQYDRFLVRQNTPGKEYKLTEDDWHNREKFEQYAEAMNDMVNYTNTDLAPWYILPSVDKRYARINALKIFNARVREYLNTAPSKES